MTIEDIKEYMHTVGKAAREASRLIGKATTATKNQALVAIAEELKLNKELLVAENQKDWEAAKAAGLESALVDRLVLNEKTIASMAEGLRQIADLPDPIGEITDLKYRPSGIQVGKMRVPLGVI